MSSRLTQWLVMRARSSRRKSPWNLLLGPMVVAWFLAFSWVCLLGVDRLLAVRHPDSAGDIPLLSGAGVLAAGGTVVAALLPAFLMANLTVWLIPAARRAMDGEAQDHAGAGFRESNLGLLRGALVLVPLGLLIAAIGVWIA